MAVSFRLADPADQHAIAALWFEANRARQRGREIAGVDPSLIGSRIVADGAFGYVAEDDGELVGAAILSAARTDGGTGDPIEGLGHLNTVAVAPARWGEGIARTILRLVVDEARERDYTRIQLYTQPDNARARDLYERNGWRVTGEQIVDALGEPLVRLLSVV